MTIRSIASDLAILLSILSAVGSSVEEVKGADGGLSGAAFSKATNAVTGERLCHLIPISSGGLRTGSGVRSARRWKAS